MNTRISLALAFVGIAVLTLGRLFKTLHWPGANIQILIGSLVLAVALAALAVALVRGRGLKELL